ncbi:MAG: hypothetical protein FGM45_07450 [Actinobacteria bacterium]|nr:hypothetical protein [Actinomycetota bacterium]
MKRLLITGYALISTALMIGTPESLQAAAPATLTVAGVDPGITLSSTTVTGPTGDTFVISNTSNRDVSIQGPLSRTSGQPRNCQTSGNPWCVLTQGGQDTFRIDAQGSFTVTVYLGGGFGAQIGTVAIGPAAAGGGATGPATTVKASYDPNGGTCIFNGTKTTLKYDSFTIGFSYAPGNDECARPQCVHVGWNVSGSATTPVPANLPLLKNDGTWLFVKDEETRRSFVAKSGDFVADWVQAPKFNDITLPTNGSTGLVWDSGCRGLVRFDGSGPCSVNGRSSVTVSGQVTISTGGQAGSCTVRATPVFTAYQNLDGTDLSVTTSASTLPSSTFTVKVEGRPRLDVVVTGLGLVSTNEQPGIACGEGSFLTVTPVKYTFCGLDGAATRTLYAWPQLGQSFLGWDGACKNTPINAACTVKVTGPTTAVARFGLVNLTVGKQGSGTVSEFTFSTPRINCGATCSAGLLKDSPIFLVAAPAPGQYFVEWAGACAGTPSTSACSLTVANDTKATAVFAAGNRLVVDIDPREGNNGVVWSLPYGLICGGPFEACDVSFPPTVGEFTLFVLDGRDHRFSGWGGACSGTATTSTCSVSFATGSKERRVTVSYEEREWVPVATFDDPILGMSRDGRTVLTGAGSTTRVLRENSLTGEWKSLPELPFSAIVSRLSGDGNTVVTCVVGSSFTLDVVVRRWNEASSTWNRVGDPIKATDSCPDVVSDNGSMFATGNKIYDWRAGTGSWVERTNPKDFIFEAVNRQGTVAVFATLSSNRKLSYATYRWNADTSTWTTLEAIEGSFSIDRISDDGRFLFDFNSLGDQVYDTSLKSSTFPFAYRLLVGGSVRGDAIPILEVYVEDRGPRRLPNLTYGVSVHRWDPTTSRWVQSGRVMGVGYPEGASLTFGVPWASLSDESPGRISILNVIYEWSFPRR